MQRHAHTFLLSAALTVGAIGAGLAADLPVKAPPVVAPPPVVPFSWTGFYIGGNIGYGWGNVDTRARPMPSPAAFGAAPFTVSPSPDGVIGGIQIGYNWQAGTFVYGIETDFQGADITGHDTLSPLSTAAGVPIPGWNSRNTAKLDYLGTLRARVGFTAMPELLLYVTGGLAYGNVKNSSRTTFTPLPPFTYVGSASSVEIGWTVGGGFEYAFANNWTVKAEYLYVDLDASSRYAALPLAPNPPFRVRHTPDNFTFSVARVGINYKFSPWW